ncbi:hypothetical protein H2203_003738 [Taxawa tesnikishii (nom. ined.)]|nr:hypothetical protein H2203_003738 [Dothideales sp. JES 119]
MVSFQELIKNATTNIDPGDLSASTNRNYDYQAAAQRDRDQELHDLDGSWECRARLLTDASRTDDFFDTTGAGAEDLHRASIHELEAPLVRNKTVRKPAANVVPLTGFNTTEITSDAPAPQTRHLHGLFAGWNGGRSHKKLQRKVIFKGDLESGLPHYKLSSNGHPGEDRQERRRCCGMPLWFFVILTLMVVLVVAAVIIVPVALVVAH